MSVEGLVLSNERYGTNFRSDMIVLAWKLSRYGAPDDYSKFAVRNETKEMKLKTLNQDRQLLYSVKKGCCPPTHHALQF